MSIKRIHLYSNRRSSLVLLFLSHLLHWGIICHADDCNEAIGIEAKVIESRKKILSGVVDFTATFHREGSPARESEYVIDFDGTKSRTFVRQGLQYRMSNDELVVDDRTLLKFVFTEEAQLFHSDLKTANGKPLAAQFNRLTTDQGAKSAEASQAYQITPSLLGAVPVRHSVLARRSIYDFLTRPDRKDCLVEDVVHNEIAAKKIRYTRKSGQEIEYLIDPQRDYAVLQCSIRFIGPNGGTVEDMVQNKIGMVNHNSVKTWYPTRSVYTRSLNEVVGEKVIIDVDDFKLNATIDPQIFTLAGLEIPAGLYIEESPRAKSGARYWNGSELQTRSQVLHEQSSKDLLPQADTGVKFNLWLVVGNIFVLISLTFLFILKRKSGSSGTTQDVTE